MSLAVGVPEPASPPDWSWPAFWFVCPFLLGLFLLAIVAVIALLKAEKKDVPAVFSTFGSSLVQVARRRAKQSAPAGKDGELDAATRHTDDGVQVPAGIVEGEG